MSRLHKVCKNNQQNGSDHFIKKIINHRIGVYCKKTFIRILLTSKNYLVLSARNAEYFKENLGYYLNPNNANMVLNYLEKIKKSKKVKKIVSNIITNYYAESSVSPTSRILKYVEMSPRLASHIKQNGLKDGNSKRYLPLC